VRENRSRMPNSTKYNVRVVPRNIDFFYYT
jgi:hypothetical protein